MLPGDVLGGSLFASEHRGESTVEVLNATGVDPWLDSSLFVFVLPVPLPLQGFVFLEFWSLTGNPFVFFALLVAPFELFSLRTFQSFCSPKAFLEPGLSSIRPMPEDYCCLGNHEFDYGGERLRELMSLSRFPWLGSNVREARRGKVGRCAAPAGEGG